MRPTLNEQASRASNFSISDTKLSTWLGLDVDWVYVNCWAARGLDVQRGEIVIFTSPKGKFVAEEAVVFIP